MNELRTRKECSDYDQIMVITGNGTTFIKSHHPSSVQCGGAKHGENSEKSTTTTTMGCMQCKLNARKEKRPERKATEHHMACDAVCRIHDIQSRIIGLFSRLAHKKNGQQETTATGSLQRCGRSEHISCTNWLRSRCAHAILPLDRRPRVHSTQLLITPEPTSNPRVPRSSIYSCVHLVMELAAFIFNRSRVPFCSAQC